MSNYLSQRIILAFFISVCAVAAGIAQLDQDSEKKIIQDLYELTSDSSQIDFLIEKSWENARVDPAFSLVLLGKLDSIITASDIDYSKDVMYYYYGIIYKNLGQFDDSETWLLKYYDFHKAKDNNRHVAVVTMALANLYSDQGKWAESMEAVIESRRLYELENDTLGIIRTAGKMGHVLSQLDRDDTAMGYHKMARQFAEAIGNKNELSIALSNIGNTYESLEKYDSAYIHYELSERINREQDDKWGLVYDVVQIGRLNLKIGDAEKALPYTTEGMVLSKEIGSQNLMTMSQLTHGVVLIENQRYREGIKLLEELVQGENAGYSINELRQAHEALYTAYKNRGNVSSAMANLEEAKILSDSLLNDEITKQVSNLEIQYETEKKEKELALLNAENEVASLRLKASQRTSWGLAGVSLLFIGFALSLWRLNKKITSQKVLIEKALHEKDTLLREIHHRVKNNLQVISSLLNLQSRHLTDEKAQIALKEGQNRVKSMALIHKRLYQGENLTSVQVGDYLSRLAQSLFTSYNVSPNLITLDLDIADLQVDVDTLIPLGLIINELISNSLKHAFPDGRKGKLYVSLKEEGNKLRLRVTDDGVGLDEHGHDKLESSFGYKLINTFSSQLDASISFETKQGTTVDLLITDYKVVS